MTIGLRCRPFWERHGVDVLYAGTPVTVLEAKPERICCAVGNAANMVEISTEALRVRYHGKVLTWQQAAERLDPSRKRFGGLRFVRNGAENGKCACLVQRKAAGTWITIGSVVHDGEDWVLRYLPSGRIERYETLSEAKDAALKI
jgi:hypothetical protein